MRPRTAMQAGESAVHLGYAVHPRPRLSERTTIGLGGEALAEIEVRDPACLPEVSALAAELGGRPAVLGRGSNLLVRDGDVPLVLISLHTGRQPRVLEEADSVRLHVPADLALSSLLTLTASMGLTGLEGLAGIPGSVGGGLRMNAGSFGVSLMDRVKSVEAFIPGTGMVVLRSEELSCSYRSCEPARQEEWFIYISAVMELRRADPESVRAKIRQTLLRKKAAQPVSEKSAGCVFKNPSPDQPAGLLLERSGMKGRRLGGMQFSTKHANFLINMGNGTYAEAEALITQARAAVKEATGIDLELEVWIWP